MSDPHVLQSGTQEGSRKRLSLAVVCEAKTLIFRYDYQS